MLSDRSRCVRATFCFDGTLSGLAHDTNLFLRRMVAKNKNEQPVIEFNIFRLVEYVSPNTTLDRDGALGFQWHYNSSNESPRSLNRYLHPRETCP
jgi:hypothetical protein